jgi:hypothetical protein
LCVETQACSYMNYFSNNSFKILLFVIALN